MHYQMLVDHQANKYWWLEDRVSTYRVVIEAVNMSRFYWSGKSLVTR